jgi:formyltetrahydrofolate hydrolase
MQRQGWAGGCYFRINGAKEHQHCFHAGTCGYEANRFFARLVSEQHYDPDELLNDLRSVLPQDAIISVNPEPEKKIIVLVTKEYHCLSDILVRNHFKTLGSTGTMCDRQSRCIERYL